MHGHLFVVLILGALCLYVRRRTCPRGQRFSLVFDLGEYCFLMRAVAPVRHRRLVFSVYLGSF